MKIALFLVPLFIFAHTSVKVACNVPEKSGGPDYVEAGGIQKQIGGLGVRTKPVSTIPLTAEEQKSYGELNRLAIANGDPGKIIAEDRRGGYLPVGLRPLRVGLVYFDAHGDFNTPETTLSGMLGGMPVAIAAGMALTRMRLKAGLDPAIPQRYIVEGGVRDNDPLEQDLLDRSEIEQLSGDDISTRSEKLHRAMEEVPGRGPTSAELGAAITEVFKYEKAAAFGVASTPFGEDDSTGVSRQAAYNLILGAIHGVQQRR